MIDWTKSMSQTFEYYTVDPSTWGDDERILTVKSSTINRDKGAETLGSASFSVTELLGESYIRVYLIASQNGVKEKVCLGTFLAQTPSSNFNGRIRESSIDAYTPLIELKENKPPVGYTIMKNSNIMENVYMLTRNNLRAPVAKTINTEKLYKNFTAETDETWLSFLIDLLSNAKYEFCLDEKSRILFTPKQEITSLQPVWTFNDDNSSILLPSISMEHDIYGIPNAVEVIYSENGTHYEAKVTNNDPNSPISTINRGREILHRVVNPSLPGVPSKHQVELYATNLLKELSSVEFSISYSHGYCPVRLGDCVRLNYTKAGITDIKARVTRQSIECNTGCTVTETAVFTNKLWR